MQVNFDSTLAKEVNEEPRDFLLSLYGMDSEATLWDGQVVFLTELTDADIWDHQIASIWDAYFDQHDVFDKVRMA